MPGRRPVRGEVERTCDKFLTTRALPFELFWNEQFVVTDHSYQDVACESQVVPQQDQLYRRSPDGARLALLGPSGDKQGLWIIEVVDSSYEQTRFLVEIDAASQALTWVDERRFAVHTRQAIELFSADTGESVHLDSRAVRNALALGAASNSPLLLGVSDEALFVWDTSAPQTQPTRLDLESIAPKTRARHPVSGKFEPRWPRWALTPKGHSVVLLSHEGKLHVVSLSRGAVDASLSQPQRPISAFAVSADGHWLATGTACGPFPSDHCETGRVELYALPDLKLIAVERAHFGDVKDVVFDAKSERLATLAQDGLVIWSLPNVE